MKGLERVFEEKLQEISCKVEEINIEVDESSERKFIAWNYPSTPSYRCKQIIEKLHEIARSIGLDGPIQEYRIGKSNYWVDICFILPWNNMKIAIEIDDEHHFDEINFPGQKLQDKRKNKTLEKEGWKVKRIPFYECDRMGPERTAWFIIGYMMNEDLGISKVN